MNDGQRPGRAIIEKIKKLLELSRDPSNEHEAALAAEKARQFLEKHNLSIGEVELAASEPAEIRVPCAQNLDGYFVGLCNACNLMFDTAGIQITNAYSGNSWYVFCGLPQNVAASAETLRYFIEAIRSLARSRANLLLRKGKRSERANARRINSYRIGAATRIYVEVENFKRAAEADANRMAIVKVGTALAARHIDRKYAGHRKVKGRRRDIDSLSYGIGWNDGGRVSIHGWRQGLPSAVKP